MNKKIVIIVSLIVILSFAAGITLLVMRDDKTSTEEVVTSEIREFKDVRVVSAVPSFDNSAIWYFDQSARLYRADPETGIVSEFSLPSLLGSGNITNVSWPLAGNDFLATTASSSRKSIHYYNNTAKEYKTWPSNIQNFDWMPDGRRVAYIWQSGDGISQQLVMANADTSGFRIISEVFWPDLKVKVSPNGSEALLVRTRPEGSVNKIYKANLTTGEFETLVEEGKNLNIMWLPKGDKFLYSRETNSGPPMVIMYNFATKLQNDMRINANLDKIVVDQEGNFAYIAVAKADGIGDRFLKIDLNTLQQEVFHDPADPVTAKNLFFVNGDLYFINVLDQKLYYLQK